MNRLLMVMCWVLLAAEDAARGQEAGKPAAVLELVDATGVRAIDVAIVIDGRPFDVYWQATFDAIFAYADVNGDGVLKADEVGLVPSARAVRVSLGSGFAPPIAPVGSVEALTGRESASCSRAELRQYYLRQGAGALAIGCGRLSGTAAITEALVAALDRDRDGRASREEIQQAESALRRYDANDDELIGVGELVATATYPGNLATMTLRPQSELPVSGQGNGGLVLRRPAVDQTEWSTADRSGSVDSDSGGTTDRTRWRIRVAEQIDVSPFAGSGTGRIEGWGVPGLLNDRFDRMWAEVTAVAERPSEEDGDQPQRRQPSRDWLVPLVDRNRNQMAEPAEVEEWLALQKQIVRGQILLSVYTEGGLFEVLDADHNAGLSPRELRAAWQTLESASCTEQGAIILERVPTGLLLVVSQGYPERLARTPAPSPEWFRQMDRNSDGDVSRREFTGSPARFQRVDADGDGLLSREEAGE